MTATTPGVISSPNYPFYYAQYKSCVWYVKPSNMSRHLEIDFIVLDLAPPEKSGGKCHDQLIIYHGNNRIISIEAGTAQPLVKSNSFRQHHFPKKIISNGSVMVTLKSCFRFSMSRYQGFLMRYRETDCPGCGIGDAQCSRIHNCSSSCGQILSINYPLNYVNNHRCQWLIRAPPGHYFNVTIEDFDIVDTVKFRSPSSAKDLGRGEGGGPSSAPSSGNQKSEKLSGCIFDHLSFTDVSTGIVLGTMAIVFKVFY